MLHLSLKVKNIFHRNTFLKTGFRQATLSNECVKCLSLAKGISNLKSWYSLLFSFSCLQCEAKIRGCHYNKMSEFAYVGLRPHVLVHFGGVLHGEICLCLISPHSSLEERITMPSFSSMKAGGMGVISSCLPDLYPDALYLKLALASVVWREEKQSYTIRYHSVPGVPLCFTRWKFHGFFLRSLFVLFLSPVMFRVSFLWIVMNTSDLVYTSLSLFLCIAAITTIIAMAVWVGSGRFVRHSTVFSIVGEILLPYTCIVLLESFMDCVACV